MVVLQMMHDIKRVPLDAFKKDKRQVVVDFENNVVRWKKNTFKIIYINVGGKQYPYVIVKHVRPWSEIRPYIHTITLNKSKLKHHEYEMNGDVYYIIGIGDIAIKAYKNDNDNPEYFRYKGNTEAQDLLELLYNKLVNDFFNKRVVESTLDMMSL